MKHLTRKKSLKYPKFQNDSRASEEDPNIGFEISRAFIQARMNAGLTQEGLAKRMGTTQSVIERLESGQCMPSTDTINRLAQATGALLCIKLDH
jgi:ribosome-binding protein aMBF1 (putative translation factor)